MLPWPIRLLAVEPARAPCTHSVVNRPAQNESTPTRSVASPNIGNYCQLTRPSRRPRSIHSDEHVKHIDSKLAEMMNFFGKLSKQQEAADDRIAALTQMVESLVSAAVPATPAATPVAATRSRVAHPDSSAPISSQAAQLPRVLYDDDSDLSPDVRQKAGPSMAAQLVDRSGGPTPPEVVHRLRSTYSPGARDLSAAQSL